MALNLPTVPDPQNTFGFQGDSVPHHSGDNPGVDASHTPVWPDDEPRDNNFGDNDWNDPGSINSGLTHDNPTFGRGTGNRY